MKQSIIIALALILFYGCAKKATQTPVASKPIPASPVPVIENKNIDTAITYSLQIKPLIDKYCLNCHASLTYSNPVALNNYQNIKINIDNGEIYKHVFIVKNMPPRNQPQLTENELKTLEIWLNTGAKE